MEITIKVDDSEGPFLIELLRKFSFVQEVKPGQSTLVMDRTDALWAAKAHKLFATPADLTNWLHVPNQAIGQAEPITLLRDDEGYQMVLTLLGRMEHGIMA